VRVEVAQDGGGVSDELDQVVRALEAERHQRSVWWHTEQVEPEEQLRRLEAALDAVEQTRRTA